MKTPLIFLLLINLIYLSAQEQRTTFFTRYDTVYPFSKVVETQNHFILTEEINSQNQSAIVFFDKNGNKVGSDSLTHYPRCSYNNLIKKTSQGYAVCTSTLEDVNAYSYENFNLMFTLFNEDNQEIFTTEIISPHEDLPFDFIETEDNGFLILSTKFYSSVSPAENRKYLVKINNQGDVEWEYLFNTPTFGGYLHELTNGNYLVVSRNNELIFSYLDNNGNLLNEVDLTPPLFYSINSILPLNDEELMFSGSFYINNQSDSLRGAFLKVNVNGIIEDSIFFQNEKYTIFNKVILNNKGNYLVLANSGTAESIFEFNISYSEGYFFEMDTNFNILWTKEFDQENISYKRIYDLIQSKDNGYLITGAVEITSNSRLRKLYKLDCNACDSISCYFKDSICNPADCIRYQNDNLFSVEVDSTQLVNNVINIDLFNSEEYDYLTWDFGDGTQLSALLLTQSFEYEYNNPGFYDISLIFSKGICTDTTTFNLYVGAGLKLSENEENTLFQLYPNPNNGTFTLQQEFGNEIGLKLINSLGSIIYKKESLKQSEKISLSLDSGLYFLLLENDAEIYQQKMIVK